MLMNSIISNSLTLDNLFQSLKYDLFLTKPQYQHLQSIINAMVSFGFKGKVSDVSKISSAKHRTSITRFLSSNAWNDSLLRDSLVSFVLEAIWTRSRKTGKPIYFIVDDTISEKTKPSSKAVNVIEKCSFHNSHLKGKVVYGHQILVTLLACDGLVLPYSFDLYDKEHMSKIELSQKLIESLPKPSNQGYVLCDSWYSCKSIIDASIDAGFQYIGALKTNRVVYPEHCTNLGIKLSKLGANLNIEDFDLVTVKDQEYYIYNYQGKLKDIKNVSIVLSYPKDAFQNEGALKTFISLDMEISPLELLTQYTDRWAIEPFFRDCKTYLGLDGYQIRSERSILRYLLIMFITYTYCKISSKNYLHFNSGYKLVQNKVRRESIIWIYNAAQNGESIEKIFKQLKIA